MRGKILCLTAFAVLASFLMLSNAVAQPIMVRTTSNMDLMDKYKKYKEDVKDFAERLANDKDVKGYLDVLKKEPDIVKTLEKIKNSVDSEEKTTLGQNLIDLLATRDEAKAINDIINTRYVADIENLKTGILEIAEDLAEDGNQKTPLINDLFQMINSQAKEPITVEEINTVFDIIWGLLERLVPVIIMCIIDFILISLGTIGFIITAIIVSIVVMAIVTIIVTIIKTIEFAFTCVVFSIIFIVSFKEALPISKTSIIANISQKYQLFNKISGLLNGFLRILRVFWKINPTST